MKTLYERLEWICRDLNPSISEVRPKDIEGLLRMSSGRPSQIKEKGEAARLGARKLEILTEMGYSAAWIQQGIGSPRISDAPPVPLGLSAEEKIRRIQDALRCMLAAAELPMDMVEISLKGAGSEESHSSAEQSANAGSKDMKQNAAWQPQGLGRTTLDPTAGACGEKKSPAGKAGEG